MKVRCIDCVHARPALSRAMQGLVHCAKQSTAHFFNPAWPHECAMHESKTMDEGEYYRRVAAPDGSFETDADRENKMRAARLIAQAWGCVVGDYGKWAAIDFYLLRTGSLGAVLEVKTRDFASDMYPSSMLNMRKWWALHQARRDMDLIAIYAVQYVDGIKWIRVDELDAHNYRMGGCRRRVKSATDREPMIHIPIGEMHALEDENPFQPRRQ